MRLHGALDPVKGDPGLQFPHPGAGVASGQHVQDQIELLPRQPPVGRSGSNGGEELIDRPSLVGAHGDDGLTERVQRILQGLERFDVAFGDRARQRCRLEQVMGVGAVQGS